MVNDRREMVPGEGCLSSSPGLGARDLRMVPIAASGWAAALLVVFLPGAAPWLLCVAALGGVAMVVVVIFAQRRCGAVGGGGVLRALRLPTRAGVAVVSVVVGAAVAMTAATAAPAREEAAAMAGRLVQCVVTVVSSPVLGSDGRVWAEGEGTGLGGEGDPGDVRTAVRIGVPAERSASVVPGSALLVRGEALRARAGERAVLVLFVREEPVLLSSGSLLDQSAAAVREAFARRVGSLPGPGADLLPGLVVGYTRAVGEELDAAMRASGLSHLTAVSGSNCALVTVGVFGLVALLGGGRMLRVLAAAAALGVFVVLVTPEPSVVRAATMSALAMLCLLLGRPRAGLPLLLLAVPILLIGDPWLSASPGFALSVAATGALLVLVSPLSDGLSRWMPRALGLLVAVPLSAQLACAPIIALFAEQQSLVSVFANLLAEPAAPVATVFGLLSCLAAPLPPLADLLASCAWLPSSWIAMTAVTAAALPAAAITVPAGIPTALAVALVSAATLWLLTPRRNLRAPRMQRGATVVSGALVAVAVGFGGGNALVTGPIAPLTRPAEWAVAACDVGQGDALLVRSSDRILLVDTGPAPETLRSCLNELGIGRIDLLVLTHFDRDHAGGASALVGRVGIVLHGPPGDRADERQLASLASGGARVVPAAAGQQGVLGEARWRVLWPRRSEPAFVAGNDVSVVVAVEGGGVPRSLFLGDMSAASQAVLRRREAPRGYPVVKVAHHGSADQDPALYEGLRPVLGIISAGRGNDYGHPRRETLDLLRRQGTRVARTDESGMLLVGVDHGVLRIWSEHPPASREPAASGSAGRLRSCLPLAPLLHGRLRAGRKDRVFPRFRGVSRDLLRSFWSRGRRRSAPSGRSRGSETICVPRIPPSR